MRLNPALYLVCREGAAAAPSALGWRLGPDLVIPVDTGSDSDDYMAIPATGSRAVRQAGFAPVHRDGLDKMYELTL